MQHVTGICDGSSRHLGAVAAFQCHIELCEDASRAAQEYLAPGRRGCGGCDACRQASSRAASPACASRMLMSRRVEHLMRALRGLGKHSRLPRSCLLTGQPDSEVLQMARHGWHSVWIPRCDAPEERCRLPCCRSSTLLRPFTCTPLADGRRVSCRQSDHDHGP